MQIKKRYLLLVTTGILTLIVTGVALAIVQPVKAQCGSQASSCKNCHEVQAKDPVNNDGTGWHKAHAFGDFCYICHAGNNQATDKAAAHTGMVSPLADVKASCAQCHPNDLDARAQVYASALGVKVGTGSSAPAATPAPTDPSAATTPAAVSQQPATQQASLAPNDQNIIDYVQRYNANVLGENPINWGNVILLIMIGAMAIGGGSLVLHREGFVRVSFKETKPVEGEYPTDVVNMIPDIAKLKPNARKALRRLLEKPEATAEVLTSIDKLTEVDPTQKKE
jgi:hypothetical protein